MNKLEIRRKALLCGFKIDEKKDSVALEWHGVPYLHARHPVLDRFREWALANGFDVVEGADSVEARRHSETVA
ncbi:MAG TPA: hypothetical protein VI391_07970 [Thermoanaerobaculia bacterium]